MCMARVGFVLVLVMLVGLGLATVPPAEAQAPFTVVTSGLNTPRGLTFGPDGKLYVAEAGTGGDEQIDWGPPFRVPGAGPGGAEQIDGVPPFRFARPGTTGRILRIDGGEKTVIASGLQSIAEG